MVAALTTSALCLAISLDARRCFTSFMFLPFLAPKAHNRASGWRFQNASCHTGVDATHAKPQIDCKPIEGEVQKWSRATLRNHPRADLLGSNVLLRCDFSTSVKEGTYFNEESIIRAVPTITYLVESGARVVIASHWLPVLQRDSTVDSELIAELLSLYLNKRVRVAHTAIGDAVYKQIEGLKNGDVLLLGNLQLHKEEIANDKQFSKALTRNIDVMVNEAFPLSHRMLASTVGAACFADATIAGLEFERELLFISKALNSPKLPFTAIVGGSKVSNTIGALNNLLRMCGTIVLTGPMVYTFLCVAGFQSFSAFTEKESYIDALKFLNSALARNVKVILPTDFVCIKDDLSCETFPVENISKGWQPVCAGYGTLEKIRSALRSSSTALWIGPFSMGASSMVAQSSQSVARTLAELSERGCYTLISGKEAITAAKAEGVCGSISHICRGTTALFVALKGLDLPAVSALDCECPKLPKWESVYKNMHLPLFVDIGSGNGLFSIRMAKKHSGSLNFLGFEVRKKLVQRCSDFIIDAHLHNLHFITSDATVAFKKIISTYPGPITYVAIQCPVPEFRGTDNRRRMVRQNLIKAIVEVLSDDGKVTLLCGMIIWAFSFPYKHEPHFENFFCTTTQPGKASSYAVEESSVLHVTCYYFGGA